MVLRIVRRASTVIAVVRSGRNNGVMDTRGDEPHALELFEQRGSETRGGRPDGVARAVLVRVGLRDENRWPPSASLRCRQSVCQRDRALRLARCTPDGGGERDGGNWPARGRGHGSLRARGRAVARL